MSTHLSSSRVPLGRLLGGGELDTGTASGHWEAQGGCSPLAEVLAPGNSDWCELPWRSPFQHQDQGPPNNLQAPVLESLRPNSQL